MVVLGSKSPYKIGPKMTIQIPKDISEVTPQLCRQVFTEIVGGEAVGFGYIPMEGEEFKTHRYTLLLNKKNHDGFNPFLNSQDTLLCMPWVSKNNLRIEIMYPSGVETCACKVSNHAVPFRNHIWEIGESIPFTIMLSILEAFNKLEEK